MPTLSSAKVPDMPALSPDSVPDMPALSSASVPGMPASPQCTWLARPILGQCTWHAVESKEGAALQVAEAVADSLQLRLPAVHHAISPSYTVHCTRSISTTKERTTAGLIRVGWCRNGSFILVFSRKLSQKLLFGLVLEKPLRPFQTGGQNVFSPFISFSLK